MKRIIVTWAWVIVLSVGSLSQGQVMTWSGDIEVLPTPPESIRNGEYEGMLIRAFEESRDRILTGDLPVDATAEGLIYSNSHLSQATIPTGSKVNSYMFHYDPIRDEHSHDARRVAGRVTFKHRIIGIQVEHSTMHAGTDLVGYTGTDYSYGRLELGHDYPPQNINDAIHVGQRYVEMDWGATSPSDNVRVITAAQFVPTTPGENITLPDPDHDYLSTRPRDAKNLILVAHGYSAWVEDSGMRQEAENLVASIEAAIPTAQRDNFHVVPFTWTGDDGSSSINPVYSFSRAGQIGTALGKEIAADEYDHVHLIGHSMGAKLVHEASKSLDKLDDATIHATFLDPFHPPVIAGAYGKYADWADNYISDGEVIGSWTDFSSWGEDDLPFTNPKLKHAYNVDVTELNRQRMNDTGADKLYAHWWPWGEFYANTTTNQYAEELGFELSLAGGGYDPAARAVGQDFFVPGSGAGSSVEEEWGLQFNPILNLGLLDQASSATGTINTANNVLDMATGSPVWHTMLLQVDGPINLVRFDLAFTSVDPNAMGYLTVYWDGALIGSIEEQLWRDGLIDPSLMMFLPGEFGLGSYELSFRLDPLTDVGSSIQISNVTTGLYAEGLDDPVTPIPAPLAIVIGGGLIGWISMKRTRGM